VKLDPLSGAACSPDELHAMTEELIEANEAYLPTLEWPDEATPRRPVRADD
jgi:alpha-galactosidase